MSTAEEMIKNTIRQTDGIEIIPSPKSRMIEYDQIDGGRKYKKPPKDVSKWRTGNFVSYARKLHKDRYNRDWIINYAAACQELLQVKDYFIDILGKCDNKMLYRFIQWFFDNHADGFMNRNRSFYFRQMRQDWIIDKFVGTYQAEQKSKKRIHNSVNNSSEDLLNEERIAATYLLSEDKLVMEYGVVIAVNWLLKRQNWSSKECAYAVFQSLKKLNQQGLLQKAIEATHKFNPYPSSLRFLDAQWLVNKVDSNIKVSIKVDNTQSESYLNHLGG